MSRHRRERSMAKSPERSRFRMGVRRSRERVRIRRRSPSPDLGPPRRRARRNEVVPLRRNPRYGPNSTSGIDKYSQWFCLGVFGMSYRTTENDLRRIFDEYGPIESVRVVCDPLTRDSRGFGFVYFRNRQDALKARARCDGLKFDNRRLRVDFSTTDRPHSPTPGRYMGPDRMRSERRSNHLNRSPLKFGLFRRDRSKSPSPIVHPFVHPRFRPLGSSSGTSEC